MARDYYLIKNKNGFYYAEFTINGSRIVKSTKTKDIIEAGEVIGRWKAEGLPVYRTKIKKQPCELLEFNAVMKYLNENDIDPEQALTIATALKNRGLLNIKFSTAVHEKKEFIKFLYDFWDYDNSIYLKDKRAHGKSVTKSHCKKAIVSIKRYYEPYFKNKVLSSITRNDLREFGIELKKRLAGKTVNNIILFGGLALRWAYYEKIIPENITEKIGGFSGGGKGRDTFTADEIKKLKNINCWDNKMAYTAFMLASTSALRRGECLALQRRDIGENILYIRHGYNHVDGLKTPKNGEERTVYVLPEVRGLLLELLADNPHERTAEQFIFYSEKKDKPCGLNLFSRFLKQAIGKAGINIDGRMLDFHSLRHYVAKKWADNNGGDLREVSKVTGHRSISQAEHYAQHTDEQETIERGKKAVFIFNDYKKDA